MLFVCVCVGWPINNCFILLSCVYLPGIVFLPGCLKDAQSKQCKRGAVKGPVWVLKWGDKGCGQSQGYWGNAGVPFFGKPQWGYSRVQSLTWNHVSVAFLTSVGGLPHCWLNLICRYRFSLPFALLLCYHRDDPDRLIIDFTGYYDCPLLSSLSNISQTVFEGVTSYSNTTTKHGIFFPFRDKMYFSI